MHKPLYFDYNATAPIKKPVCDLVCDLTGHVGNASSSHSFGRESRKYVEQAREQVAALVQVAPGQVVFNGGATEGNNTVLHNFHGQRVLTSAIEHPAVIEATPQAERIPVTADGVVDLAAYEALLENGPPPALVSVMAVNNETGVIQPVGKIGKLAHKYGALFHCDGVQAAGRMVIDMARLHIDYLTLSGHKIGGPQGVGALVAGNCENGVCREIPKLLYGGGQERRHRAGTENVAGIAGLGLAAELAQRDYEAFQALAPLRDRLESALRECAPEIKVFGEAAARVANTLCFTLPGVPAKTLLMNLDLAGIAVSGGSACSSGTAKGSHVLMAMGATPAEIGSALRVSIGWDTTPDQIDYFIETWSQMYRRMQDKVKRAAHA